MEREDHQKAVLDFIGAENPIHDDMTRKSLSEALYSVAELGLMPDGVRVSTEQALMLWRVVEVVKKKGFPPKLRM